MAEVEETAPQAQGEPAVDSAEPASTPGQQMGTLDVDAIIAKLLGFKNNPGKQVRG